MMPWVFETVSDKLLKFTTLVFLSYMNILLSSANNVDKQWRQTSAKSSIFNKKEMT